MRKAVLGALIVALASFGSAATVAAGPITIHLSGISGVGVTLYSTTEKWVNGQNSIGTTAGAFLVSGQLGTFDAYCVDLKHYVNPYGYDYDVDPVDNMADWNGLGGRERVGGAYAAWLYNTYAASANSAPEKAALQLAIWEMLYDQQPGSITSGSFYASSTDAVLSQATFYLRNVGTSDAAWLRLRDTQDRWTQDLMGPVPEPGTLLLVGSGVVALALRLRRRA